MCFFGLAHFKCPLPPKKVRTRGANSRQKKTRDDSAGKMMDQSMGCGTPWSLWLLGG